MELKALFEYKSNAYVCLITQARIIDPGTKITSVTGRHFGNRTNIDVDVVEFKETEVHYFPRNLHVIFPRLSIVLINDCGLREIHREDLEGLEKLRILNLSKNLLEYLPNNLFSNMINLKRTSFWQNRLGRMTSEVLSPLVDADYIEFRDNPDVNCFYKKEGDGASLGSVEELMEVIDLSCLAPMQFDEEEPVKCVITGTYNAVKWRDDPELYTCQVTAADIMSRGSVVSSVSGLHMRKKNDLNVQAIDFADLNVSFFPRGFSDIFGNLKALSIEKCGLRVVTKEDLKGLGNLEQFYVGGNLITWLPDDLFEGMSKLTQISFKGNKIKRMSSQLIKNIAANQPTYVDFRDNATINVKFEVGSKKSVKSLEKLFEIMDKTCRPCGDRYDQLRNPQAKPDFTFISDDFYEFPVFKSVIKMFSPVFDEYISKNPDATQMEIKDASIEVIESFLAFIYLGQSPKLEDVSDVMKIAKKFKIEQLKRKCQLGFDKSYNTRKKRRLSTEMKARKKSLAGIVRPKLSYGIVRTQRNKRQARLNISSYMNNFEATKKVPQK